MKLETKKRIAREVLIFSSIGILVAVFYLLTFLYNGYFHQKIKTIQSQIDTKSRQLDSIYKRDIFIESISHHRLGEDSLPIFDKKKVKDINLEIDKISNEMKSLESERKFFEAQILSNTDKLHFTKLFSLVIFLLSFPLRYFYYLILWSIKTIRLK